MQRGADNKDFTQDAQSVRRQIEVGVERLKAEGLEPAGQDVPSGSIQVVSKRAGGVKPPVISSLSVRTEQTRCWGTLFTCATGAIPLPGKL